MSAGPPDSARTQWWAERAWLGGGAVEVAERVLLTAAGERFTAVEVGVDPPAGVERLAGLTVPGLANAHSHAFHRALRGRTHTGAGDFWAWRDRMYQVAARLEPDSYQRLAAATYAEMALSGITAVAEFHYLHHGPDGRRYADPNAMGAALVAAAEAAGVRLTLLDACYLQADVDGRPLAGAQTRFGDGDVQRWAERVTARRAPAGVVLGVAAHSVRAVPAADLPVVAEVARSGTVAVPGRWVPDPAGAPPAPDGMPLHAHLSEQRRENEACRAVTGRTPTALLAEAGALGEGTTVVHATHLTAEDIRLLGGARTAVCFCPTTERDLADGVGPAWRLVEAGCRFCLGSDSHAVIDLWEEARAVEMDERLATERRGHHRAADLLTAATAGGMAALGRPDGGLLRPGALADFATIRLDSPRLAGAGRASLLEHAVFAATAADVTDVVVGGRPVVRGGRHLRMDVAAELAAAVPAVTED